MITRELTVAIGLILATEARLLAQTAAASPPIQIPSATAAAAPSPAASPEATEPAGANAIADVVTTGTDGTSQKEATEQQTKQQEEAQRKAEEAKKKADAEKLKRERIQKLQKIVFDRRPSTTLRFWSTPLDGDEDEKQTGAGDESKDQDLDTTKEPTAAVLEAQRKADDAKAFDEAVTQYQRDVTLGNWAGVKSFLAGLEQETAKAAYAHLLRSLLQGPRPPRSSGSSSNNSQRSPHAEKNSFDTDDVFALADVAPTELERTHIQSLGGILRTTLTRGSVLTEFVDDLKAETTKNPANAIITPRQAARILFDAGRPQEAGDFLPSLDQAKSADDHEALNLLSRYQLAIYADERKPEQLEQAWHITQAILTADEIEKEEKEEALKRSVELAPKVRKELGQTWLEESYTKSPERGMEVLAAIGTASATGLARRQPSATRLQSLQLQSIAINALLESSAELAQQWKPTISLLANNWLREATHTYTYDESTRLGPRLARDRYGNYYYGNEDVSYNRSRMSNQPDAIVTAELLKIRPSEKWLEYVHQGLKPKFQKIYAQLYLKVSEEADAFPYIETLAQTHPKLAKDLVDEFLRVWTRNHDPNANSSRSRSNFYVYSYGYSRNAEGIPLTRSKQQRNIKELSGWVARLKELPVELDESLLFRAFSNCHSTAEVYRMDAIEEVFGSIKHMKPKTIAAMAQQMRHNLKGVWRAPAVQKENKTNRKQKDIEAEVLRGYGVARGVIQNALDRYPDSWQLQSAIAAVNHDENEFQSSLAKDSEFSARRQQALDQFRSAAQVYIDTATELPEQDETIEPFTLWFQASLGACDLADIDEKKQTDQKQMALIREAIDSLPGEQGKRHMAMFANALFTRMSSLKPGVKFNYLKSGFEIVGDHEAAHEAQKVYQYYKDLVTEIKLEAVVDGSDAVGQKPFGLFVNILHTREIERESGGFAKYLQNQNNGRYYYNYGRPTEDYRDKFEEFATKALEDHFEVMSVTFQPENVRSKELPTEGWRVTPYAYLLLKARGPEVDKIAPLRMDFDFLDTSGYAVIPVETPMLPIDAQQAAVTLRPFAQLNITQTLDDRESDKLKVEVKATARGLVPDLDQILNFDPSEFDIVQSDDQGLAVSRFDPDADENVVLSERTWMISLHAKPGLAEHPKSFQFAAPKPDVDVQELTFQRFQDADLAAVEREVSLEQDYGEPSRTSLWWTLGLMATVPVSLLALFRFAPKRNRQTVKRFQLPQTVTPFTVLGLLKDIEQNNGLDAPKQQELASSINRIETYYFEGGNGQQEPNIQEIAETWVRQSP